MIFQFPAQAPPVKAEVVPNLQQQRQNHRPIPPPYHIAAAMSKHAGDFNASTSSSPSTPQVGDIGWRFKISRADRESQVWRFFAVFTVYQTNDDRAKKNNSKFDTFDHLCKFSITAKNLNIAAVVGKFRISLIAFIK